MKTECKEENFDDRIKIFYLEDEYRKPRMRIAKASQWTGRFHPPWPVANGAPEWDCGAWSLDSESRPLRGHMITGLSWILRADWLAGGVPFAGNPLIVLHFSNLLGSLHTAACHMWQYKGSPTPNSTMESKYIYSPLIIAFLLMWYPNYWREKEKNKTWFLDKISSLRTLQCPRNQGDLHCERGMESINLVMEEKQ